MAVAVRKHSKIVLAFALVLSAGVLWTLLVDTSQGAQVTSRSDSLNNSNVSATSNHAMTFTVQNGLVSQACGAPPCFGTTSSTLSVAFPVGFDLSNLTCGDVNMATGTQFLFNVASPESRTNCLNTGTSWGVLIDSGNRVITFTTPTSASQYAPVATGTQLTISIGSNATFQNQGTHWVKNPSSAQAYSITVGGTFGGTGNIDVAIQQALQLSATIAENLTFTVSSVATPNCTANDGASVTQINTTGNTVPYGTISANTFYQGCQDLSISTNAGGGYSMTAQENSALMTPAGFAIPDTACDQGQCSSVSSGNWVTNTNYGFGHTCLDQTGHDCSGAYAEGTQFRPFANVAAGNTSPISYVQDNTASCSTGVSQCSLAFLANNTAKGLIIVAMRWLDTNLVVNSVTDTLGNTYVSAGNGPLTWSAGTKEMQVFYAKNIAGGANTVTVTYSGTITLGARLLILEYSGLDTSAPLDVTASSTGNSFNPDSGFATTNFPNELLFGFGLTDSFFTSPGTSPQYTNTFSLGAYYIAEYAKVASAGSYHASASISGSNNWGFIMATFKASPASGEIIMSSSTPAVATGRVKYRLSVPPSQAAGTYTNLVDFIATPTF